MENMTEKAIDKFNNGYNCCQAVLCAYCELFDMREKDAIRITEGFGSGIAGLKETCGAVTGMAMTAGLINSAGDLDNPKKTKPETYRIIQEMMEEFREMNGSLKCGDILNGDGDNQLRSCEGCVEDASNLIQKYFSNEVANSDIL